ncbi:MAG: hypothetical protein WCP92_09590 [bacterium]
MFIPMIKYIPILIVVVMVTFLAIFIKKARDGTYTIVQDNKLAIFVGLGEWIMNLFEVNKEEDIPKIQPEQPTPETKI